MFRRREKNGGSRIDTLIGRNASIQGDIEFSGGLHVDGRVAGSVRAATAGAFSLSEHGVIEGAVQAPQVAVNGRVDGDIFGSERVALGSKARVRGNVHYGVIEMALGAQVSGRLVSRRSSAAPPAVAASAGTAGVADTPASGAADEPALSSSGSPVPAISLD